MDSGMLPTLASRSRGWRRGAGILGWALAAVLVSQCALADHDDVAAFGDSLTEGYPFENDPWIARLGPDWNGTNLGLSSERSADGLIRLQSWLAANPGAVHVVVLMEGTNDTDEGSGPPWVEAQTVANMQAMVQAVADYGAIPILMAPPPVLSDAGATAKLMSFAATLETWANANGVIFVNLFEEFSNHPDPGSLYYSDQIHFSDAGNAFVAQRVLDALPVYAPTVGQSGTLLLAGALLFSGSWAARRRSGGAAARAS